MSANQEQLRHPARAVIPGDPKYPAAIDQSGLFGFDGVAMADLAGHGPAVGGGPDVDLRNDDFAVFAAVEDGETGHEDRVPAGLVAFDGSGVYRPAGSWSSSRGRSGLVEQARDDLYGEHGDHDSQNDDGKFLHDGISSNSELCSALLHFHNHIGVRASVQWSKGAKMITTYFRWYEQAGTDKALENGARHFVEKFQRRPQLAYVPVGELDGVVRAAASRLGISRISEDRATLPGTVSFLVGVCDGQA